MYYIHTIACRNNQHWLTYINPVVQLCLHGVLAAEVGGQGVVALLPLLQELLLVVGAPQVLTKLTSVRGKETYQTLSIHAAYTQQ